MAIKLTVPFFCTFFGNGQFAILAPHNDRGTPLKTPPLQPFPFQNNCGRRLILTILLIYFYSSYSVFVILFDNGQFIVLAIYSDRRFLFEAPIFQPCPLHYNSRRPNMQIIGLTSHCQISNCLFNHFHLLLIVTIHSTFTVPKERQLIPFLYQINYLETMIYSFSLLLSSILQIVDYIRFYEDIQAWKNILYLLHVLLGRGNK